MKALVVAAGIVFWTLVLGVAWLAFFPGGDTGEPVAILQIEPGPDTGEGTPSSEGAAETPNSGTAPATVPAAGDSGENMAMPPGFAVAPGAAPQAPVIQPPAPGQVMPQGDLGAPATPEVPDSGATDGRQGAAESSEQTASTAPSGEAASPAGGQLAAVAPPPPPPVEPLAVEPGAGPLPPVPVAELVEESQYGPLPKIASDGRRAIDVYARPSKYAAKNPGDPARVAILVSGLGLPDSPPGDMLKGLPPSVSVAYGAYGRSLQDWVNRARADGHEVLLQIPLEPNDYPKVDPGPHTLLTTLPPEENLKRLQWLMSRYTGYVGITNQMGSKFEATREAMTPVLEEAKARGLLYVDDGSVKDSTAGQIASTIGLDYSVASVEIDANASAADIAKQLAKLEAAAKEKGAAIGVVKAKPAALKQLAEWAGKLQSKGLVLVPVSAAVRSQSQS